MTPPVLNKLGALACGSLAEFVHLTAEHRTAYHNKIASLNLPIDKEDSYSTNSLFYNTIAKDLPKARRIRFDDSVAKLVERTDKIPSEDMIGQLCLTTFAFDTMWIEGPMGPKATERLGALVKADQSTNSCRIYAVLERQDNPEFAYNKGRTRHEQYIQGGKVLDTYAVPITISPDGIRLDEDKLLAYTERFDKTYKRLGTEIDASRLIDVTYSAADYFTRLLVVMGSSHTGSDFNPNRNKAEIALDEKNRKRVRDGRTPILATTPVRIDLTRNMSLGMDDKPAANIQEFLGITQVKRSKLVCRPDGSLWLRKSDGMPWSREPHSRKTKNPQDRTNAERHVTVQKPDATIEISPDRPPQIVARPKPDGANLK